MNLKKCIWLIGSTVFVAAVAACRQPSAPTPIAIPTPNLTLTALFEPTETIPPSVTPPAIQTATPMDAAEASPTPVPTQTNGPTELVTKEAPTEEPGDSPTATNTPTAVPDKRTGPTVDAVFIDSPPAIDGDLDDWDLDAIRLVAVVFGANNHAGPEDLSGTFMVGWDETQLYIAAMVVDDTYVQNAVGEEIFKGDSLEVLLDKNLRTDFSSRVLSTDDYQLGISPGAKIGDTPAAYLWYPEGNAGPRVLVDIAAAPTDDGYQVEIAIPWSVFGISPSEGDIFGFGFSISDNDEVGSITQQTMVSNVSTRNLSLPTTWGNLLLAGP